MQKLVGKTTFFDDQEVEVYYYDKYINELLIWNEEMGLKWITGSEYQEKRCGINEGWKQLENVDKMLNSKVKVPNFK